MLRSAAVLVLLALAFPAAADAARKPTGKERKAILAAVDGGHRFSCTPAYPPKSCRRTVRISTARTGWAVVRIVARRGYEGVVQEDATSVTNRGNGWRMHEVGAARSGCGVPSAVVRDLKLLCL